MTKRICFLFALILCASFTYAQTSSDLPMNGGDSDFQDEERKEINEENYFPPKPKHGTEIGLNLGHFFVHGDVWSRPGWGVGLHLRRALNYTISLRLQAMYGQAFGLDDRPSTFRNSGIEVPRGNHRGGADQRGWGQLGYSPNSRLYRNYKTHMVWGSFHFVVNTSNILFHKKSNKWNLYAFAGPTLTGYKSFVNIRDKGRSQGGDNPEGPAYLDAANGLPGMTRIQNPPQDDEVFFSDARKELKEYLDDSYETEVVYGEGNGETPSWSSFNWFGNETFAIMPGVDVGAGIAFKITKQLNIALEHQAMVSLNDNIDGHVYARNVDVPHYTNLKINFNINPKEGVEPLYWVNPLTYSMKDIAELKKRNPLMMKDADGDGVVDQLDEEPDTPKGCPVDVKGRRLDSDGDGVYDCDDDQPYTPHDLVDKVDDKGYAAEPEKPCCITAEDIKNMGRAEGWYEKGGGNITNNTTMKLADWFLPMIHFDLDKCYLKNESKAQLHHVARVMKDHPEVRILVIGHTDRLNNNAYNQVLSYNRARTSVEYLVNVYGISRDRLVIQYGGEESPLVDTNSSSYINRRVEFRVARGGESDMGRPEGPNAGKGCYNSGVNVTSGSGGRIETDMK